MTLAATTYPMIPFSAACKDSTSGQPKVQNRTYLDAGRYPIVDQGQQRVAGYTDDTSFLYSGELPVVLFGDHTRIFKYVDYPFALGADGVKVLSAKKGFIPKFLYYYFQCQDLPSRGYSRHFKFLQQIAVGRPPPSEQRRIVEILDQADALRKKRAEADKIADRILPALFYKMFGDPATWPANSTERLGGLVDVQGGGTPSKQNHAYWGGDFPWVSPKDMKRDFIDSAADHITKLAVTETNVQPIPVDSILVVVRGMILARYVPIAVSTVPVAINQDMKALSVRDRRVSPLYLLAAMKGMSHQLRAQVSTAAHGTRKLDTERLLSLSVLIPDEKTHQEFVTCFTRTRKLAIDRKEAGPKLDRLFSTLLHRAFSGDLTAKWREAHMKELLQEMAQQEREIAGENTA
ncbi:MAG: restriction endonuclease subunit S [Lentisphaerae bacterium]|nr:restriction endonuclease subunit S [Lentisphaerota bacterium]